ncbi:hypothetical protein FKP32DRAFT_1586478 [Trametes sanguinea]|nr:hypothetical protein FKP32DRAFT_1586478 [Trametes sanguinea]
MDESDRPSGAETFVRQMPLAQYRPAKLHSDAWKSSLGPWRLVGDGMIHDEPTQVHMRTNNPQPTTHNPPHPAIRTNQQTTSHQHLAPTPRNRNRLAAAQKDHMPQPPDRQQHPTLILLPRTHDRSRIGLARAP